MHPDGSVDIPSFVLPFSVFASAEAKVDMEQKFARLTELENAIPPPPGGKLKSPIDIRRDMVDRILFQPFLDAQKARYDVTVTAQTIAGVGVQVFTPSGGIGSDNARSILLNLHGGGFVIGWGVASQIESIPMAAVAGIKVVSIDYGMFPEKRFPAASEDVAAVYGELLKTYDPLRIGIYGGSAGGILASLSMAWFDKVGLPIPAAIAIWSAPIDPVFAGDSAHLTPRMGSYIGVPKAIAEDLPYFAGQSLDDPLVSPLASKALLAKFPPTLLLTGTRASDLSAMTRSHLALLDAGVDARIALWDGLDHTFMYNPELPESRQAYAMTAAFFSTQMDRDRKPVR